MRRSTVLAAVSLAVALVASACGDDGGSGGSVTMWVYPVIQDEKQNQAFWDEQVSAFEKDHPDIDVTVRAYPWKGREEALSAAIAGGKAPDVVYAIPDELAKYNDQHVLQPVQDMIGDLRSDLLPSAVDGVTIDGQMYGAPVLLSVTPVVCDKRVFKATGAEYPKTWDDLLALAPVMRQHGYETTVYRGDLTMTLNSTFYPLLWQAGGDVFDKDGNPDFDSDAGVEALEFVKKLVDSGAAAKNYLTEYPPVEQTSIAKGKVACLLDLQPKDLSNLWGEENLEVLPPLEHDKQVGYGALGSFAVLRGAKDKDAAGEWLRYLTSPEVMSAYDKAGQYFSPRRSVNDLYSDDPLLSPMQDMLQYAVAGPVNPKARELMDVLAPQLQAALLGQKSPRDALAEAAKAAEALS